MNRLKAQTLNEINALLYVPDLVVGNVQDIIDHKDVQEYQLVFSNCSLEVRCDAVAVGLTYCFNQSLVDIDMHEHGAFKKVNLSDEPFAQKFIGQKIKNVANVILENNTVGLCLDFENTKMILINLGDDIYLNDQISSELSCEGYLVLSTDTAKILDKIDHY